MGYEISELQVASPKPAMAVERLISLDAYRGFVMLAMVSGGLGMGHLLTWMFPVLAASTIGLLGAPFGVGPLDAAAALTPGRDVAHPTWGWLADQFSHRLWEGCTFWDLIQPSFMFIVGVAMPFAFAVRQARGDSWGRQFGHAVRRALLLVAIGIFLDSFRKPGIEVQFIRVLQQIAFGYLVAFLVLHRGPIVQAAAAGLLLLGHTIAFEWYGRAVGVDPWAPKVNLGAVIDQTIHAQLMAWANQASLALLGSKTSLNLWPVSTGNYVTVNAISSAATILVGVVCGELLRSRWSTAWKIALLFLAGIGGLLLGGLLSLQVPMVKRIWTSSFGMYAAGWTYLMILLFYVVIDVLQWRRWAFPFVVVGMNSIAIYVSAGILNPVIRDALRPFVGSWLGSMPAAGPVILAVLVVAVQWLLCYWLYRQRIFFRV
jgi:predicted acyltransferase